MKSMIRMALLLGLSTFGAASLDAAEIPNPDGATHEVRVVNNFQSPVRVYAQDAEGRLHQLGRVARGQFKVLEIAGEVAEKGAFRIKVYPNEPAWSLLGNTNGIKTRELDLDSGDAVLVWLETDLTQSMIEVQKG